MECCKECSEFVQCNVRCCPMCPFYAFDSDGNEWCVKEVEIKNGL